MKRFILVLLSVLLFLPVSSAVFATVPICDGDCEGWSFSGSLGFGTSDYMDYEFTVELTQGTTSVYYYMQGGSIHRDNANFVFYGGWGMELCGDYTMTVVFTIYGPWGTYTDSCTQTFTCNCDVGPCGTPGFWKSPNVTWPVDGLTVGCVPYTKAELLAIFDWSTRGDMTIILFQHLVAAKLNVADGAVNYIDSWITAGDDFLCIHPLGSKPKGDLKTDAETIKDHLTDYNESGCEGNAILTIDGPVTTDKAAAAAEESSWGSIKKKNQ